MAEKTVTVYHPTFEGVAETVSAADVEAWTDQGWRKTAPKSEQTTDAK